MTSAVEALARAVRVLILTLKMDPALSMSRPSLGPWRELEEALKRYEQETKTNG